MLDSRPWADDDGTADHGVDDLRSFGDHDLALDPALVVDGSLHVVLLRVEDGAIGFEHVGRLAGVLPPPLDDVRVDGAAVVDEPLNRVGDLELVAPGWFDRLDRIEDRLVEHVDTDESEVRFRLLRLLGETDDLAFSAELGDAELRRIRNGCQEDLGVAIDGTVLLDQRRDAVLEQVVSEVHHEWGPLHEILGNQNGVGQTARLVLLDVLDAGAEMRSVPDLPADLVSGLRGDDDRDLLDAGCDDRLDAVLENGFVRDRDELLGRGVGQRAHPGAFAAGEDEALHLRFGSGHVCS